MDSFRPKPMHPCRRFAVGMPFPLFDQSARTNIVQFVMWCKPAMYGVCVERNLLPANPKTPITYGHSISEFMQWSSRPVDDERQRNWIRRTAILVVDQPTRCPLIVGNARRAT